MSPGEKEPSAPRRKERNEAAARFETIQAFEEQVTLFKYLSPVECHVMYKLTDKVHYEDGETILVEGEPGTGLHIVESGEVIVSKKSREGGSVKLAVIGQYGHFGEMSILNNQPASTSIIASGPVDVLVMTRTQFTNLIQRSEALGVRILRALCEELSNRLRDARRST